MKKLITALLLLVMLSQVLPFEALATVGKVLSKEEMARAYAYRVRDVLEDVLGEDAALELHVALGLVVPGVGAVERRHRSRHLTRLVERGHAGLVPYSVGYVREYARGDRSHCHQKLTPLRSSRAAIASSTYFLVAKCALAVGVMPDTAPVKVAPASAAYPDRSMEITSLVMSRGDCAV